MTSKQKAAATGTTKRSARALEHGLKAAGARFRRKGFSHTAEWDLRFALGYPHFVELIEGDPRDADPARATAEIWRELLRGKLGPSGDLDRRVWPRAVAANAARILAHPGGSFFNQGSLVWGPTAKAAKLLEHGPVDRKEASSLLRLGLSGKSVGIDAFADLVLILEALLGPEAVLEDLVDLLEEWRLAQWARADLKAYAAIYQVALLLLRVRSSHATAHRTRLGALQRKAGGVPPTRTKEEPNRPLRALDVVLHGGEGARRSAMPFATPASVLWELAFVPDDAGYVADRFCALKGPGQAPQPDARVLFLGGPRVFDHQRGWWSTYKGAQAQRTYVRTHGEIRAPQIVTTMVEMLARSKVKAEVRAWFLAHRAFALPHVRAAKGAPAKAARALLEA